MKTEVYDARQGGIFPDAFDRYTVIFTDQGNQSVYTMSHNAMSPQGVNMYMGWRVNRRALGKRIPIKVAPEEVQKTIKQRRENERPRN